MSDIKPLYIRTRSDTTSLKQPKEIGHYSRKSIVQTNNDGNVQEETKTENATKVYKSNYLINDNSYLSYYYLPNDDLDKHIINLSGGFAKFKDCSPVDDLSLHGLLDTLISVEQQKNKKTKVDLITMRGIMKSLIVLFNCIGSGKTGDNHDVNLQIATFDGQIFMKKKERTLLGNEEPQREEQKPAPRNPRELSKRVIPSSNNKGGQFLQKCQYSGYKFETCATLPRPVAEISREKLDKRYKKIASNDEQYNILVKTGIGHCKMVLGAEVDGVFDFIEDEEIDNLKHYLELKSSKMVTNAHQAKNFENKLFSAWLQCFLVGIPRVTFGFRDDDFNLVNVEEFIVSEIPMNLKNMNSVVSNHFADCIKWYGAIVEWLKTSIEYENGEENYYTLQYQDNYLKLNKIEDDATGEYKDIISQRFRDWRASIKK